MASEIEREYCEVAIGFWILGRRFRFVVSEFGTREFDASSKKMEWW